MLSKTNINIEIIEELMNDDSAAIWLMIKRRGKKRIYIGGIYREHRLLMKNDDLSATDAAQLSRWEVYHW